MGIPYRVNTFQNRSRVGTRESARKTLLFAPTPSRPTRGRVIPFNANSLQSRAQDSQHLPLYLAEVDYKYNTREETDGARTALAVPKMVGKRLRYRDPIAK